MGVREISPELQKVANDELGEEPARTAEDIQKIKEWLSKQRHISARTDDQWILAFLRGCKFSLERTKQKIDAYYTMKSAIPEISSDMDPMLPKIQEVLRNGVMLPITTADSAGPRIMFVRPGRYDATKITTEITFKVMHMINAISLLEDDHSTIVGQRYIIDLNNVTKDHFFQMTPATVKKMVVSGQDSLPIRQKGSHHINSPPGIETIIGFFKRFMNEKNRSRLMVHPENKMDEFYEYVPKKYLPTEYGGEAGPEQDMIDYWKNKVESYRDWFIEDLKYKTDESKRPGKPKTAETLFGIEGSFRQLTID